MSGLSSTGCPPRFSTSRDPKAKTYGGRVAEIARELGQPLMPWQRHVADVALEIDPRTGRLRYREVVLTVPRQSGKTTLIMALAVHRALGFGSPQNIVYAAQTRNDAAKKLIDDQMPILASSPFRALYRPRLATGKEAILWANGSRHGLVANTEKSGHGATLDLGFIDEAFAQIDDRLEQAFSPAMITRPQPQQWVVSTMGTDASTFLNRKIEAGRHRLDGTSTAFFEWSADPDADPADPDTWRSCMPALGHTVTVDAVAAEFEKLELGEFKRAYLNIPTKRSDDDRPIDVGRWLDAADPLAAPGRPLVIAADVAPNHTSASLVAVGPNGAGKSVVELIDNRNGASWLPERLRAVVERHGAVVALNSKGPIGSLIPDLERLGVAFTDVSGDKYVKACGAFAAGVHEGSVIHRGQEELAQAVMGARRRHTGDAWSLSRSDSGVDITPLVAAIVALWASSTERAPLADADLMQTFH